MFVQQCMSRKILDALEDVITKGSTSPVVKERLLDVLAAAAYASQPRTYFTHLSTPSIWSMGKLEYVADIIV